MILRCCVLFLTSIVLCCVLRTVLIVSGIIFFFVALTWDVSAGRRAFWMIICAYEICVGAFLIALELPYAPLKETLSLFDNTLLRFALYLM